MFWDIFVSLCARNNTKPNPVAKELNISSGAVTKWKKEGVTPNSVTLHKIAEYFNVSVDYLLGNTEKKEPAQSGQAVSSEYKDLIILYDSLSDEDRDKIKEYMEFLKSKYSD
jgi:transcriptional regulator with XRE-family HTH domain